MALEEEVIRLVLETKGQETIEALQKSTKNYAALLEALQLDYANGEVTAEEYTKRVAALGREYERQTELLRAFEEVMKSQTAATTAAGQAEARMAEAIAKTTVATKDATAAQGRAAGGVAAYRENLTGLSYALNDFFSVQGGLDQRLNSMANNLPMLMAGFGGIGLAASAVVPVLALLIKNFDDIKAAFGDANELPKAADSLKRVGEELETVNGKLDEFKKRQHLSNEELADYNRLSVEQVRLEKEKTEEQKRRAEFEKLQNLKPDGAVNPEVAKATQRAIANAPDADLLHKGVEGAMREEMTKEALANAKVMGAMVADWKKRGGTEDTPIDPAYHPLLKRQTEITNLVGPYSPPERLANKAKDTVSAAAVGGDTEALKTITGLMDRQPEFFTDDQVAGLKAATPEALQKKKMAEAVSKKIVPALEKLAEGFKKATDKQAGENTKDDTASWLSWFDAQLKQAVGEAAAAEKTEKAKGKGDARDAKKVSDAEFREAHQRNEAAGKAIMKTPLGAEATAAAGGMLARGADSGEAFGALVNPIRQRLDAANGGRGLQNVGAAQAAAKQAVEQAREQLLQQLLANQANQGAQTQQQIVNLKRLMAEAQRTARLQQQNQETMLSVGVPGG